MTYAFPKPFAAGSGAGHALIKALVLSCVGIAVSVCANQAPLSPEQQKYLDADRARFPIDGAGGGFGGGGR